MINLEDFLKAMCKNLEKFREAYLKERVKRGNNHPLPLKDKMCIEDWKDKFRIFLSDGDFDE